MPLICRTGGLYLLSGSITGMRKICLFILCFLFSVVPVSGPAAESVSMPAALDYTAINKQLDKMAKSLSSNKATPAETVPMLDDLDGFYNQINQADISYRVREKVVERFRENNINIPFPQRVVRQINETAADID